MDSLAGATPPDPPQVQDDLAARSRPRHPRAFAPLREDNFAGGLGDPAADGQVLASVGLIAHPTPALFQIRLGVLIDLGLAPQAALVPQRRRRLSDPSDPLGPRVPLLPHPLSPMLALGSRTKDARRQLLHVLTRMGRIAGVIPVIRYIDQAQPGAIDLAEDGLE